MKSDEKTIQAFAVSVKGSGWPESIVNARSAGQAKVSKWRDIRESWESVPFTAMRVRKAGNPGASNDFKRMRKSRGIEFCQPGMRVRVSGRDGWVVGHNSSGNLDVLMDGNGIICNCHPHWEIAYFDDASKVIRAYDTNGKIIEGDLQAGRI